MNIKNRRKYYLTVLLLFGFWTAYYGWSNQIPNVKAGIAPAGIVLSLVVTTVVLTLGLAAALLIKRYVWVSTTIAILAAAYLTLMGLGAHMVGFACWL